MDINLTYVIILEVLLVFLYFLLACLPKSEYFLKAVDLLTGLIMMVGPVAQTTRTEIPARTVTTHLFRTGEPAIITLIFV